MTSDWRLQIPSMRRFPISAATIGADCPIEYEIATPVCVEATRSKTNPVDQIAPPIKSQDVAMYRAVEEAAERNRFTDERVLHEVEIPDEAGKQRAEAQKDADAVGAKRVAVRHGVGRGMAPKCSSECRRRRK